ncbi:unnamed protein product, partial [Adineta steineri]
SYQNPTQGVHEHFYSQGKCYTRILIAPKHLLSTPQNATYRQSISSTYSLSQIPITRQNSPYQNEKFLTSYPHLPLSTRPSTLTQTTSIMLLESPTLSIKNRTSLNSFVDKMKYDQTKPLLNFSTINQTIQPYGYMDKTINS